MISISIFVRHILGWQYDNFLPPQQRPEERLYIQYQGNIIIITIIIGHCRIVAV
jgi:hypothetical protein